MKRILFLFTVSLLFLACSNDDSNSQPEEQTDFKIKKLSKTFYLEDGTSYRLDYLYDLSGKRTKWIQDYADINTLFHDDYLYNELGQILESKTTNIIENYVARTISYEYDTSNRISSVTYTSADGFSNTSHLTYENNTVFVDDDFGGHKSLIFNEEGKLIETFSRSNEPLNGTVTETINYNGDLVSSIHYEYSIGTGSTEDYVYEYDNKTNPLFENFKNNINNYIYNFTGSMKSFKTDFSANNFTKVKFTSTLPDPNLNYTDVFTTQYNPQGFPISAEVKRNGVLFEKLTYEYY